MAKEEPIVVEAIVTEALPNARFRAKLESGHEILAHVSGKMRMHYIRIMAGDKIKKLDIDVNVKGGGIMGQADATRTAIARGIVAYLDSRELESLFKERDRTLLASDPRRKMPKKPMGRGARKKRQKSYR